MNFIDFITLLSFPLLYIYYIIFRSICQYQFLYNLISNIIYLFISKSFRYEISLKTSFIHLYTDYTLIMYIYTCVRRIFPDLYRDKNAQTVQKASERLTRRGNDQTTIYTTAGIIHACTAFWRVG